MQKKVDSIAEKFLKRVGLHLKAHRKAKGYSQFELSVEAGLPKNQVGRIERGEINTTIGSLKRILDALGVSFSEFFITLERSGN